MTHLQNRIKQRQSQRQWDQASQVLVHLKCYKLKSNTTYKTSKSDSI